MAFTTTNFGISYDDWWEGPTVTIDENGGEVIRPVILAWSDQRSFIKAMLGYSEWHDGVSLVRTLPEFHTEYVQMYAVSASLRKGIGEPAANALGTMIDYKAPGGAAGSGKCIIDLTYRAIDYYVISDEGIADSVPKELGRFVSRSESYATESVTLGGGGFKYTGGNPAKPEVVQEPGSKLFFTKALKYTWHQVPVGSNWLLPAALQTHIQDCLGMVNAAAFDTRYTTAETVLFLGPEIRRVRMSDGGPAVDIDYNFVFRPSGWNRLWRAGAINAFAAIEPVVAGGAKLYPTADFNSLFELA